MKAMIKIIFLVLRHSLFCHKRFYVPMKIIGDTKWDKDKRMISIHCNKCESTLTTGYRR